MYTLYFLPGACSLATQAILHELNLPVELIHKQDADHYESLNPSGTVPVLIDQRRVLNEGVAILLYLLDKHDNQLIAGDGEARHRAIEHMLLANTSMHPAYGRLFFIERHITQAEGKQQAFAAAASAINALWAAVETKLQGNFYLGGESPSPADFLLAVYSRWGQSFPVDIVIGPSARRMIGSVIARDSFQKALQREKAYSNAA